MIPLSTDPGGVWTAPGGVRTALDGSGWLLVGPVLILNSVQQHGHKVLIERIQRRFTKMILHLKNIPYEERLAKLKLWSLEDRQVRADLIEVFKITHGYSLVTLETFFEIDSASIT